MPWNDNRVQHSNLRNSRVLMQKLPRYNEVAAVAQVTRYLSRPAQLHERRGIAQIERVFAFCG